MPPPKDLGGGATYYYRVELMDGDNPDFDSSISVSKSPYFEVDNDTIAFTHK